MRVDVRAGWSGLIVEPDLKPIALTLLLHRPSNRLWRLRPISALILRYRPLRRIEHRKRRQPLALIQNSLERRSPSLSLPPLRVDDDALLRYLVPSGLHLMVRVGSGGVVGLTVFGDDSVFFVTGPLGGKGKFFGWGLEFGLVVVGEDAHHGLEVVGDSSVVLEGVVDDLLLGLLEAEFFALEGVPEVLGEGHAGLDLVAGILFHQLDDLGDHLFLVLGHRPEVRGLVRELAVRGVALRKVHIQPDLDLAIPIDTDHILAGLEVADPKEYLLEAVEGAEEYIEVLREGDILNMAEADGDMFDVYFGVVVGVAEFLDFLGVDELGVDDAVFLLPPLEELQVLVVLSLVVEIDLVLLDLLAGQIVAVEVVESVFRAAKLYGRDHMPVLLLELRQLARPRLFIAHLVIKFISFIQNDKQHPSLTGRSCQRVRVGGVGTLKGECGRGWQLTAVPFYQAGSHLKHLQVSRPTNFLLSGWLNLSITGLILFHFHDATFPYQNPPSTINLTHQTLKPFSAKHNKAHPPTIC